MLPNNLHYTLVKNNYLTWLITDNSFPFVLNYITYLGQGSCFQINLMIISWKVAAGVIENKLKGRSFHIAWNSKTMSTWWIKLSLRYLNHLLKRNGSDLCCCCFFLFLRMTPKDQKYMFDKRGKTCHYWMLSGKNIRIFGTPCSYLKILGFLIYSW